MQVMINLSGFKEKTLHITDFIAKNVPENKSVKVLSQGLNVKILVPQTKINSIKNSDLIAEVDLSENPEASGPMQMPVKINAKNYQDVWAVGKYFLNIEAQARR